MASDEAISGDWKLFINEIASLVTAKVHTSQ